MKTVEEIRRTKGEGKLAVLTAYDFPSASALEGAKLDMLLVGDSLGEVILGLESTAQVTMEMMLHHVAAVRRGAPSTHVIADMPFQSYETPELALKNALLLKQAGADSVKLEGNRGDIVRHLADNDAPVVGHVGLTPQTIRDYRLQGRDEASAARILNDAVELGAAGCFAVVVECVPADLAKKITAALAVPTIGIAAGPHCDGQVLVLADAVGLTAGRVPAHVRKYSNLLEEIQKTGRRFVEDVRHRRYPPRK